VADYNYSTTQTLTRRELREQERSGVSAPPAPVVRGTLEARKTPEPKPSSGRKLLSWGTVIATPLLFIAVSLPVNLFYASSDFAPVIAGGVGPGQAGSGSQSFTVASSESSEGGVQRESWSVTSFAEVLRARYGSRNFSYSTTGAGRIRWPFPTSVPISSGFGDRVAPCRYCSSNHRGVDFTPGSGAPIFAIADGVVVTSEYGGGYGQYASIEHEINGQTILSVYAHMQRDSSPLRVGEKIEVGDFIGLVGNTGVSTGAHLHFEIRINEEYVDPFAWLKQYAF